MLLGVALAGWPTDAGAEAAAAVRDGAGGPLLTSLSQDPSFKVRLQAAILLGRHPLPGGGPALRGALGDDHPAVRAAAAVSLGRLGDPANRPALEAALLDPQTLVSDAARVALRLLDEATLRPARAASSVSAAAGGPTTPGETGPLAARAAEGAPAVDGLVITGAGVASSRSEAELQQALAGIGPNLEACGLRQVKRDPAWAGVTLRFTVLPEGRVAPTLQTTPPGQEDRFLRCLNEALAGLRVRPASGGEQRVAMPLRVSR